MSQQQLHSWTMIMLLQHLNMTMIMFLQHLCISSGTQVTSSSLSGREASADGTIITWLDDDMGTDIALSFQEEEGCAYIWEKIQTAEEAQMQASPLPAGSQGPAELGQGSAPVGESGTQLDAMALQKSGSSGTASVPAGGKPGGPSAAVGVSAPPQQQAQQQQQQAQQQQQQQQQQPQQQQSQQQQQQQQQAQQQQQQQQQQRQQQQQQRSSNSVCIKLPWPEVRTLPDINKALNDIPLAQRERVAMNIHNEGHYLPRLLEVFDQCEDIDDRDALSHLYSIIKCLIMMNDMQLVEQMVNDTYFWGVVGALEYDPDLAPKKAEHRSFLKVRRCGSCATVPCVPLCAAARRCAMLCPGCHYCVKQPQWPSRMR
jgi:flagellar motor protein MotB